MKRMDGMNSIVGLRNDHNYNNLGALDAIAEVSDESRASTPQGGNYHDHSARSVICFDRILLRVRYILAPTNSRSKDC